jgi:hypothetical protein
MSKEKYTALKEALDRAEESQNDTFDSWIIDLEDQDQPESCNIDNEDCEACGS